MKNHDPPSINFEYCFKEKFETVWNSVKNVSNNNRMTNKLFKGVVGEPIFEKGNYSYELGAEFHYNYRKIFDIHMKTIYIEKTYDYACIKWECRLDPSDTLYDMIFHFKSENDGLKCNFKLEALYKTYRNFNPGEKENIQKENFLIWSNIEKCIQEEKISKVQKEKIKISNTNIESICELLLNLREFQKNIPMCCDFIHYSGGLLEVGSKVTLEWTVNQKLKVFLLVTRIEKKNDFFSLVYESTGSTLPIPPQIIEWQVQKLSEDECVVKFIHYYKDSVHEDALASIAKNKIDILSKLKIKLESHA
jgi:hypothetical protein